MRNLAILAALALAGCTVGTLNIGNERLSRGNR